MKLSERAWQTWPLLTFAAQHRQVLTYEVVARHTGMHPPGIGSVLEQIQSYCLLGKLPPLSAIVVNKGTGLPSAGFIATTDAPRAFVEVFEFDWLSIPCPTPDQLAEATRALPSNGIPSAAMPMGRGSPSHVRVGE